MDATTRYFAETETSVMTTSTQDITFLNTGNSTETYGAVTQEAQTQFWENTVAKYLFAVATPIVFVFGCIGNALSFLVFSSPKMRNSVPSVYFRGLAVTDTIVLLFGATVFFILGAFDIDIRLLSPASCKTWDMVVLVTCYHSCWVLVFIAVDRFVGIYVPHKYRVLCSKKKAYISMAVLFVVVMSTVGVFWILSLELSPDGKACGVSQGYHWFFTNAFRWLDLSILNLIPTVILIAINVYIITAIAKAAHIRKATTGDKTKGTTQISSATFVLVSVSVVYFLCTIPSSTAPWVIEAFGNSPHGKSQTQLYVRFCQFLYLTNHGVNFLLYCIHGSTFKRELRKLFGLVTPRDMYDTSMATQKSGVQTETSFSKADPEDRED